MPNTVTFFELIPIFPSFREQTAWQSQLNGVSIHCRPCTNVCVQTPVIANRTDVLLFQSPPLNASLGLVGPVVAKLFAESNATDTDFVVKVP